MLHSETFDIQQEGGTFRKILAEPVYNEIDGRQVHLNVYNFYDNEEELGYMAFAEGMDEWEYFGPMGELEQEQLASKIINFTEADPYEEEPPQETFSFITPYRGKDELFIIVPEGDQFGVRIGDELQAIIQMSTDGYIWLLVEGELDPDLLQEIGEKIESHYQ